MAGILIDMDAWQLSPSDFAFLWQECKRCFYLKVVRGFKRPSSRMPGIFSVIDSRMKDCFQGRRTETIVEGLPPGAIAYGEKWVQSDIIIPPGHSTGCYVRGKFDTVVRFDDDTYGVIDFKTSSVKPSSKFLYARQLHAYAYALEHPAEGKFSLSPVSRLGLLVYEPECMTHTAGSKTQLEGTLKWLEIRREDKAFLKFLGEILDVLTLAQPPAPSEGCLWCAYRDESRKTEY